jgi:hypothetical protein
MAIFGNPFSSSKPSTATAPTTAANDLPPVTRDVEQPVSMPVPDIDKPVAGSAVGAAPSVPGEFDKEPVSQYDPIDEQPNSPKPADENTPHPLSSIPKPVDENTSLPPPSTAPVPTAAKKASGDSQAAPLTGNEPLSRDYTKPSVAGSVAGSSRDVPSVRSGAARRRIVAPGESSDSDAPDSDTRVAPRRNRSTKGRRASALPSQFDGSSDEERLTRSRSVGGRSRRASTIRTTASHRSGGTFANGAGTIGPNAALDDETREFFHQRSQSVGGLTRKQTKKLVKEEGWSPSCIHETRSSQRLSFIAKEGKRLSKIIQREAKDEKRALAVAMKELADLQKMQSTAIKVTSLVYVITCTI